MADGMLVDISEATVKAGFKASVAMTGTAWSDCVEWSKATADRKTTFQDEKDRLRALVYVAMLAARNCEGMSGTVFDLYRGARTGKLPAFSIPVAFGPAH